MHSFHFTEPETGVRVNIHHNGDYSGDAKVMIDRPNPQRPDAEEEWFTVPCAALTQFAGEAARDKIISAIEDVEL